MSLRLLVDEDTQARLLVAMLRKAGHDVLTVADARLEAEDDSVVLERAGLEGRIVLTRNCDDFRALHDADPNHSGIIAIYSDQISSKDMSYRSICRALTNLDRSGWDLAGQFVALNAWVFGE